jgi:hypothetical protein
VFSTSPSISGNADSLLSTQPIVTAKDGANNTASSYSGTLILKGYSDASCSSEVASSVVGTPSNSLGVVSFSGVKIKKTSVVAIKATDGNLSTSCLNGLSISPGALNSLVFSAQPSSSAASGNAFAVQPSVTAYDANSNPLGIGTPVTLTLTAGTPVLGCTNNPTSTNASGVASFTGCKLTGATGPYSLKASSGAVNANSNSIALGAGQAAQLVLSSIPASTTAGSSFNFTVTAQDASGNPATDYSGTVAITSSDGAATLPPSATLTNGVGSLSVTLKTAGNQSLTTNDGTLPAVALSSITVNPGAYSTSQSTVTVSNASVTSGSSITATLTTKDAFGNLSPSGLPALSSISFTSSMVGGTGTFGAVTSPSAGIYTASFTGAMAGSLIIGANISGAGVAHNSSVSVTPGTPIALSFLTQPEPSTYIPNRAFTSQPSVGAYDAAGNLAVNFNATITLYANSGSCDSSGDITSGLTGNPVTLTNGIASFSGITPVSGSLVKLRATNGTLQTCSNTLQPMNPPALASVTITNANPTNQRTMTLSYGQITGSYSSYCILENNTNSANCSFITGTLPPDYSGSEPGGNKTLSFWLKDSNGLISQRIDSNPITYSPTVDTISFTGPLSGAAINGTTQQRFPFAGNCSLNGATVSLTIFDGRRSIGAFALCDTHASPNWSTTVDLTLMKYTNANDIKVTASLEAKAESVLYLKKSELSLDPVNQLGMSIDRVGWTDAQNSPLTFKFQGNAISMNPGAVFLCRSGPHPETLGFEKCDQNQGTEPRHQPLADENTPYGLYTTEFKIVSGSVVTYSTSQKWYVAPSLKESTPCRSPASDQSFFNAAAPLLMPLFSRGLFQEITFEPKAMVSISRTNGRALHPRTLRKRIAISPDKTMLLLTRSFPDLRNGSCKIRSEDEACDAIVENAKGQKACLTVKNPGEDPSVQNLLSRQEQKFFSQKNAPDADSEKYCTGEPHAGRNCIISVFAP